MLPVLYADVPFEKVSADALQAFHSKFNFRGACMMCRACGRALPITHDGKLLEHEPGCRDAAEQHPWARLRALLAGAAEEAPR